MIDRQWISNNCFSQLQISGALTCEMSVAVRKGGGVGWGEVEVRGVRNA